MINSSRTVSNPKIYENPTFRTARIPEQFDNIRVVIGSEETVFNEVYVTGVLTNNRIVRLNKSALVFTK